MESLSAVGAEIVVAGIAVPNAIVIDCFAFGAAVAGVGVAVVLAFDFLGEGGVTLRSIIFIRWCLSLQMRQSEHCLNSQDLHSRLAFLPQI